MSFEIDLAHELHRWEAESENARALQRRRGALLTLSAIVLSLGAFSADTFSEISKHVSSATFTWIRVLLGGAVVSLVLVPVIYLSTDPWKFVEKTQAEEDDPDGDPLGRKSLYASKILELPPVATASELPPSASSAWILACTRLAATSLRLRNEGASGLVTSIQVPLLGAGLLIAAASLCYLIGMEPG